jgi:hypothetical protein
LLPAAAAVVVVVVLAITTRRGSPGSLSKTCNGWLAWTFSSRHGVKLIAAATAYRYRWSRWR